MNPVWRGRVGIIAGAIALCAACAPQAKQRASTPPSRQEHWRPPTGSGFAVSPRLRMVPSRDPRLVRWTPLREEASIHTDIQRITAELEASLPKSASRADAILELADAYAELAHVIESTTGHELGKCACDLPRGEALFFYRAFANEYPADHRLDSAIYFTALERELARDARAAADLYQVLMTKERSEFGSLATFGLAEVLYIYADRIAEARRYYEKVLKAPTSPVLPDAILRLAQIAERAGDTATASALYKRLNKEFPSSDAAIHGRLVP